MPRRSRAPGIACDLRVLDSDHSHPAARGHPSGRRRAAHRRESPRTPSSRSARGRWVARTPSTRSRRCGSPRSHWPRGSSSPSSRSSAGPSSAAGRSARAASRWSPASPASALILVAVVVLAILCLSPLIATNYFDGDWVMLVALIVAFAAYAPAHVARGICSGSGRFRSYAIVLGTRRRRAHRAVRAPGDRRGRRHRPLRLRRRPRPAGRRRLRLLPGQPAHRARPRSVVGRGHAEPRLAAARIGVRRRRCSTPARSPPRCSPTTATRPCVTQFAYGVLLARIPLFMFQAVQAALLPRLSRLAATGELDEFRAGLRRLLMVVLAVGVVGTLGALVLGPFVDRARLRRRRSPAGRWPCSPSAAPATWSPWRWPRPSSPSRATPSSPSGGSSASSPSCSPRGSSSDDLFRRVEIGLVVSSFAAMATFALCLRYKLASGAVPDGGSRARGDHRHAARELIPRRSPMRLDQLVTGRVRPALRASVREVVLDHHLDERLEVDLGRPAQLGAGLGGIPDQQVDLGRPVELGVLAHVAPPVLDAGLGEAPARRTPPPCASPRSPRRSRPARPAATSTTSPARSHRRNPSPAWCPAGPSPTRAATPT